MQNRSIWLGVQLVTAVLVVVVASTPLPASAQGAKPALPAKGTSASLQPNTVDTTTTKQQYDLRWVLPLLAVPILLLLWWGITSEELDQGYGGYAVGAKGGRIRRHADDDDFTEEI